MQTLRIFISSPGDVFEERAKARQVIEKLQRYYGTRVRLVPLLWEDLPLGLDASFQNGIDLVLSEKMRVDIAIFILWSRLGSPLGPPTSKLNGDPYLSGTEREMDLMLQARQQGDGKSPHIIAYVRRDDESFNTSLDAKKSDESLEELITQRKRARQFVEEVFQDDEGHNVRAFHSYDKPLSFAGRLKVHLRALIDELLGSEVPEGAQWEDSPYRGLHVFDVCHAPIFFGREQEICDLELLLRKRESDGSAFAVIVGASGSGKSSLARAGLAANLVEGNLDETVQQWRIATLMPGAAQGDLFGCLVRNLSEVLPELTAQGLAADDLSAEWALNPLGVVKMAILPAFHRAAEAAKGTVKMLLILDQLEELWTDPRIEPRSREAFLAAVEALAGSGRVWVLATLRTDFYPIAQLSEGFLKLKGRDGHFDLIPPGPASIQRIITEPARLAGLSFEKDSRSGQGLDQTLLKDAVNQPDALPLLEYALDQLYQARDKKGELSFAAYQQMGGVEGALGRKAEAEFDLLPQDVQGAFAQVFHHLVTVDEDGAENASRRTAFLSEVTDTPGETSLVSALTAQRLLATDREGDVPVIRIAHEALLRRWERLVLWVQSNREYLRLRSRVEHARTRWEQEGGNSSLLLSEGLPLEEGRRLLNEVPGLLDALTLEFIRRSVRHHEALSQRKRRTRRLVMGGLAGLTVLALLGAAASAWQWRQTSRERDAKQGEFKRAEQEKERAETAGSKARQSTADLHVDNASRSIDAGRWGDAAIHLAAAWQNDSKNEEANLLLPIALRQLEGNSHYFQAHQSKVSALALSPDGKWLASGCESGEVRIRDAASESVLHEFKDHKVEVRSLHFHQAAGGPMRLASVGTDFRVYVYDAAAGKPLYRYTDHTDDVYGAAFHSSGKWLLTWSEDSTLVIHDLVSLKPTVIRASGKDPFRFAGWTHGGDQILAVQASGAMTIWDSSGKNLRELPAANKEDDVRCAALDPSGHWLALGLAKGDIRFVDVEGGTTVEPLRGDPSSPLDLKFHFQPEPLLQGREGLLFLHVARANGNLERWRPHFNRQDSAFHYKVLQSSENQGPTATDLTGNGEFYTVTDVAGGLRLYHAPSGRILNQASAHKDGCFSLVSAADGQTWWTGGAHGEIRKWTVPGRCVPAHKDGIVTMAVDPQERFILTGGHDGLARLWEISTGKLMRELAHAPGSYSVQAVGFDTTGKHCLSAGGTEVRVWDLDDSNALPKVIQVESPHWISDAKFTGQDSQVALAVQTYQEQHGAEPLKYSDGDGWRVCSIQDGKELHRREDRLSFLTEIIPSQDGLRILSRNRDKIWQDGTAKEPHYEYHDATRICFNDPYFYLNGYLDGRIHLYSFPQDDQLWASPPTGSRVSTVDLDKKGNLAIGGDEAGILRLLDAKDGSVKFTIDTGFSAVAKALAPSDSKFVIAGGRSGEISFWDRNTGRRLITWGRHSQAVRDVRYLAKVGRCVTASSDGRLSIQECGWSAADLVRPDEVFTRVAAAIGTSDSLPASHSESPEVTSAWDGLRSSFPQSNDTHSSR